jgi:SAM-dependent methyltransferase
MRPRIVLARLLLRLSSFLKDLPVVIMRPTDMVEFSRQAYERESSIHNRRNDPEAGLTRDEMTLWEHVPCRAGRLLVLGGGGGREAIAFARQGFQVVGVDFSEGMLTLARERMAQHRLDFEGWAGDIAQFEAPAESFDVVWTSMFLYSAVLPRRRRVEMLRQIGKALKPDGYLASSFYWMPQARVGRRRELLLRAVAWLTLGNTEYENGDILFGTIEFRHAFSAEDDLRSEFTAGGFEVMHLMIVDRMSRGGAVLRKPSDEDTHDGRYTHHLP